MYAIVLSFDKRISFAKLTISAYNALWPENPFIFRVPYNKVKPNFGFSNIEYIKTEKPIRNTISNLLSNIDNQEFVYWCFDDLYPVCIRNIDEINSIHNFLIKNKNPMIDSIRLVKRLNEGKRTNKKYIININSNIFELKMNIYNFWMHHFIRCGILKKIFLRDDLVYDYLIKNVLSRYQHAQFMHNCFLPKHNLLVLGETSRSNFITTNCAEDLKFYNIDKPSEYVVNDILIYNNLFFRKNSLESIKHKLLSGEKLEMEG